MKTEPSIEKMKLKQKIKAIYAIEVKNLKFVPIGEVAASYVITTNEKKKYFLKLYFPSRLNRNQITELDFSLLVAHKLHYVQKIENIAYPIETIKGDLMSEFEEAKMVLWNYIDGKIVSEKQSKTPTFLRKLAELIAQIHDSTENLNLPDEVYYKYEITFKEDLLLCLKEIAACTISEDKTFLKLKRIITPLMTDILQSFNYLEETTQELLGMSHENYVICHNDPIRHNIILDKQGEIHLVDWDNTYFAPCEKDIWFYLNQKNIPSFKRKYKQIRESIKLNEEIVVHLFYERVLADLTDWIYRILFEELDPKQIKSDFKGLAEDVIPLLPKMKEEEERLRKSVQEW